MLDNTHPSANPRMKPRPRSSSAYITIMNDTAHTPKTVIAIAPVNHHTAGRGRPLKPCSRRRVTCYSMSMFSERLQVLIGAEQRQRLEREAADRGTSVATLVREAIDLRFPPSLPRRREAADAILDAVPMEVPDVDDLRRELDDLRGRRG